MQNHAKTYNTVDTLLRSGMAGKDIANQLNITEGRVSQIKTALKINTVKHVQIERAGKIADKHINAADELSNLIEGVKEVIEMLKAKISGNGENLPKGFAMQGTKDPLELLQKFMQELRHQLGLYLDFQKSLYDIKLVAAFQSAVLEAINEVAPDVKANIVQKLKEARAIRPNLQL